MLFLLALVVVAALLAWAAIHESLRADKAEARFDSLWKCQTCAAMFEQFPYDDEVTQCTRCAEAEEWHKCWKASEARVAELEKENTANAWAVRVGKRRIKTLECYVVPLNEDGSYTFPTMCPRCGKGNLRDKGSFYKCMDCALRIVMEDPF